LIKIKALVVVIVVREYFDLRIYIFVFFYEPGFFICAWIIVPFPGRSLGPLRRNIDD
jgi:hypothetical protein